MADFASSRTSGLLQDPAHRALRPPGTLHIHGKITAMSGLAPRLRRGRRVEQTVTLMEGAPEGTASPAESHRGEFSGSPSQRFEIRDKFHEPIRGEQHDGRRVCEARGATRLIAASIGEKSRRLNPERCAAYGGRPWIPKEGVSRPV